ncbi:hypothetical protein BC834DRAFT_686215 [Gloeopeniophorella convolvens]|nr:hypothetical protein BC834DRAFT_686215 [Gloeopeniophorella convolvens]
MYVPAIASVLLSYAALVAAQDQTVTVNVGATTSTQGGAFQFIPDNINATEGSVVTFKFSGVPGNHSITQSSLTSPCQPLPNGFDSGFVFLTSATETPTWNLTITNGTQPIWFYCKQLAPSPHCLAGMVGTFAQFQQAATSSSGNPGQNEGGLVGVGASASAPPSPLTGAVTGFGNPTGASGASPPSPSSSSSSSSSSNTASAPGSSQSSSAQTFEASGLLMTFAALLLGIA